jgi:Pilus assembly protein, PilO
MGRKALAFVHWEFLRLQRRWGWPLWLGIVLALATLWYGYQAWRLGEESKHLSAFRNGALRVEPPRPSKPVGENDLKSFYESLPFEEERFSLVKRVLLSAEKQGVLLQQVDYKLEAEAQTNVVRYQLTVPLKGDFPSIQAFLVDVLNGNRSVVIDSLSFKRESVERGDLEARVQFSILMVRL